MKGRQSGVVDNTAAFHTADPILIPGMNSLRNLLFTPKVINLMLFFLNLNLGLFILAGFMFGLVRFSYVWLG